MNETIMRSVIRHIRTLLRDPQNMQARSELMRATPPPAISCFIP